MARTYAGILGPLAFLTYLAHGVVHSRQVEAIVLTAWWSLWAFALLGSVVGWIAGRVVEDSVRAAVAQQLAAEKTPGKADVPSPSPRERQPANA